MDLKQFETDVNKTENGAWVSIGDDGAALLLARIPNPAYSRRMEALQKPYRALLRNGGRIPQDKAAELAARALSEHVVLDWRGLTANGEAIAYSQQKCFELLSDPRYGDFADLVINLARDASLFAPEDTAADAKN